MSFDVPNQILPIFHHPMLFDGPKHLMLFDFSKSYVFWHGADKVCQSFPLSKPRVFR